MGNISVSFTMLSVVFADHEHIHDPPSGCLAHFFHFYFSALTEKRLQPCMGFEKYIIQKNEGK